MSESALLTATHEDVLRVLQRVNADLYHRCVAEAVALNAEARLIALEAEIARLSQDQPEPMSGSEDAVG